jgi:signal peptidase II
MESLAKERSDYRGYYFLTAIVVLLLDQATKAMVSRSIPLYDSIPIVPRFFSITHVLNPGAAFSLFAESTSKYTTDALIGFSLAVLVVVAVTLWKSTAGFTATSIALSFIMGGALGNLLDRIRLGSVVDFLAFTLGTYHWPDFNVADSAIVLGCLLLITDVLSTRTESQTS